MSLRGKTKCSKGIVVVLDESRFQVLVTSQHCCNCMYLVAMQEIRLELAEDAGQDVRSSAELSTFRAMKARKLATDSSTDSTS